MPTIAARPLVFALAVVGLLGLPFSHPLPASADDAPSYTGTPYKGKPAIIPGVIQAEEYDVAPGAVNGISFNYNSPATKGTLRTTGDCIGLARFGNGHVTTTGQPENPDGVYVGWTHTGEWLKYTVHINEYAIYQFGGQFSAADKGGILSLTFTPTIPTNPITIPTTAGYQSNVEVYHVWEKLDNMVNIALPKGDYVMTVKIEKDAGINLDFFSFIKAPIPMNADTTRVPVVFSGGHDTDGRDKGRPVILIAAALGVPTDVFREAFTHVKPARDGEQPDPDQVRKNKQALLDALAPYGVTNDRLDEVSNYYRYVRSRGEMWPTKAAVAYALVEDGKITGFAVQDGGSGYSSPPTVTVPGIKDSTVIAQLAFSKTFDTNGAVAAIQAR